MGKKRRWNINQRRIVNLPPIKYIMVNNYSAHLIIIFDSENEQGKCTRYNEVHFLITIVNYPFK